MSYEMLMDNGPPPTGKKDIMGQPPFQHSLGLDATATTLGMLVPHTALPLIATLVDIIPAIPMERKFAILDTVIQP